MKKVRWGIVGPGIIAHEFADDFKYVSNAELIAVASRSKERGGQFAEKFNIPKVFTSYEALYEDEDIDAIYIATPHNFHLKQSSDALNNGKAVLCEKPITINSNELEELLAVANSTRQYLIEGMWTYFLPSIKKAQAWVEEGRIGEVYHVKSDFGYPVPYNEEGRMYNPQLAGGSLLDMGVYTVAMAWLFLKQDPININVVSRKAPSGVENDVSIQFKYENAVASLTTAFRCKLHNWTYIIGEKGYIAIPDFWRARECFLYEMEKVVEHYIDNRKGHGFEFEIEGVSDDILKGKKTPSIVSHRDSEKLQQHMDAIRARFNRV